MTGGAVSQARKGVHVRRNQEFLKFTVYSESMGVRKREVEWRSWSRGEWVDIFFGMV